MDLHNCGEPGRAQPRAWLEAARRLGFKSIRIELSDLDDDHMLRMLATENGTQRVNNVAAAFDSVAGITERVAYLNLLTDSREHLSTIVERCEVERLWDCQKAFETSRGNLLAGDGIGSPRILRYAPEKALERREVESSIAYLKSTGRYDEIIRQVTRGAKGRC